MKSLGIMLALGFYTAVLAQYVKVQEEVTGYLGQEVTLPCQFINMNPSFNVQVCQVNWVKEAGGKEQNVAVYHPIHGHDYYGTDRIQFRTLSLEDATLIISRLRVSDEGTYICSFAAYPVGNKDGVTNLVVLAKPINAATTQEVKIGNLEVPMAVCTSSYGRPPARITWQSHLNGNASVSEVTNTDGTVTVMSTYRLVPTKETNGQSITCIIEHKTLTQPESIPVTLSVLSNQDQLDQTLKTFVRNLTADLEVKMGIIQRSEFSVGLLGLLHGAYAQASRRISKLEDELPTEVSEGFDTVYGISTGVAEKGFKVLYEAWRKADIQKQLNDLYAGGPLGWGNLPAEPLLHELIALSQKANEKLNENLKHHLDKLRPQAQEVQNQVYEFQESVVQPVANQAVEAFKLTAEKVNQITKPYIAPFLKAVRKHTEEFKEWVSAPVFPPEQ